MKNDIRIARKVEPLNSNPVSKIYGTRSTRQRNSTMVKREKREEPGSSAIGAQKSSKNRRPLKPAPYPNNGTHITGSAVETVLVKKDVPDKCEGTSSDQKRRRPNAESYINKRFLYDVTEPPKRSRQQKSLSSHTRSTAALMAVSSANLLKRQKPIPSRDLNSAGNDDQTTPRNKRGRPIKLNMDLHPFVDHADNPYQNHSRGKINIRKDRHKTEDFPITNQSNWDSQDLYGDSTTQAIADYPLSNTQHISSLQKYADPSDMAAYSGVLLNVFDETHSPDHGLLDADVGNGPMLRIRGGMSASRITAVPSGEDMPSQPSELDSVVRSRNQGGNRRRVRSPLNQTGDAYLGQDQLQSVFSSQRQHTVDEHRTADLLSLYSEVHPSCFPSQPHLDAPTLVGGVGGPTDTDDDDDADLDEVMSSGYTSSRKQHQRYPLAAGRHSSEPLVHGVPAGVQVSEELEDEEDLLSPELSILAGSTVAPGGATVGATAGLLDAGTDGGRAAAAAAALLIPQTGAGSSRRKSPVRPMQVIRTKAHTAPTTGGHTVNQQSPPFTGGHLEPSSLILTSSVLNCGSPPVPAFCRRRTPEEADRVGHGESPCDPMDQQQPDLPKATPIGASVIRLVPGHPPVVQTFPTAGTASSTSAAPALPSRQLISTNHTLVQTASSPASDAGDSGSCALLISTTTPAAGASSFLSGSHASRLLVSSGSTAVTRSSVAATSGVGPSTGVASIANASVVSKTNTSLLSASTATVSASSAAMAPRRRPTILKRVLPPLTTAGTSILRSSVVSDADFPLTTAAVAPAALDLEQHQVVTSGGSTTATGGGSSGGVATTTTVAQGSAQAPTKLLQLVTAPLPPSHPLSSAACSTSSSSLPYCTASAATATGAAAAASPSSMTASDRLFGRRLPPPSPLTTTCHGKNSTSGAAALTASSSDLLVEANRVHSSSSSGNVFNNNTPYRYAVVRGSADGKRYLVLGNHGVFDRNSTMVNGNAVDSPSLVSPSDLLAAGGGTGLDQQILPLDPFPVDVVTAVDDKSAHPAPKEFVAAPPFSTTTIPPGNNVPSTGPTLIRRSKGSRFTNLIVTPLPPVSGRAAGDVSVATAVT